MLAFSAGMIFGVFGFEQVAEFVGVEKGAQSSLVSGLHLYSADTREASTKIAAVDSQGNGLLSDLRIEIEPGDGDVFYHVQLYAQVDLKYSTETSAEVAARLTGTDLNKVDVSFSIDAPAEIIGSPSAGAAMMIAAIAAIENRPVRDDIVILNEYAKHQGWNLEIREVSTVDEALELMLQKEDVIK